MNLKFELKGHFGKMGRALAFPILLLIWQMGFLPVRAGDWFVSSALQYNQGNYFYSQAVHQYNLSLGLGYASTRGNFSLSLPFISQSRQGVYTAGGMFWTGNPRHSRGPKGGFMHNGMWQQPSTISNQQYQWGIGDMLISASYQIWSGKNWIPSIIINGMVKVPVASSADFTTGQWDESVSFTLQKRMALNFFILDAGYMNIGDPEGIQYKNPIFEGVGIGRFFHQGRLSVLLYFQNFSSILADYPPPRQISFNGFYKTNSHYALFSSITIGLTEVVPRASLMVGINWYL